MKQSVSPKIFVAVIAVAVVIIGGLLAQTWRSPTAVAAHPYSRAETDAAMKQAHGGPTPDERLQIQEWKKTHPGASTKY